MRESTISSISMGVVVIGAEDLHLNLFGSQFCQIKGDENWLRDKLRHLTRYVVQYQTSRYSCTKMTIVKRIVIKHIRSKAVACVGVIMVIKALEIEMEQLI